MNKLHILVDQDEVIAGFLPGLDRMILDQNPALPKAFWMPSEARQWDLMAGRSAEERAIVNRALVTSGLFASLDPIPGALEALREMEADGHDVRIVTSPLTLNPTCASDKLAWINRHLGEEWQSRVILTHDKTVIRGDVLFDDKGSIPGWRRAEWARVLIEQPHNVNERLGLLSIPSLAHWRKALQLLPHLTERTHP